MIKIGSGHDRRGIRRDRDIESELPVIGVVSFGTENLEQGPGIVRRIGVSERVTLVDVDGTVTIVDRSRVIR